MANTRIRYNKPTNGVLISRRNFTTSAGATVIVELDLNNKRYRVLDAATKAEVSTGGNTRNISVLKIQAKKGLMDLGVVFEDEVRYRGTQEDELNVEARKVIDAENRGE